MCGSFLSRNLDDTPRKGVTMNPNQMNMAKSMVTMHELQDEARRSRASRRPQPRRAKAQDAPARGKDHGLFGFLGLALPGRR
jgi:hypothetical protein